MSDEESFVILGSTPTPSMDMFSLASKTHSPSIPHSTQSNDHPNGELENYKSIETSLQPGPEQINLLLQETSINRSADAPQSQIYTEIQPPSKEQSIHEEKTSLKQSLTSNSGPPNDPYEQPFSILQYPSESMIVSDGKASADITPNVDAPIPQKDLAKQFLLGEIDAEVMKVK